MSRVCRQRGFTLIELLIAVVVIAIVTSIAIPNLLNAIDRGRQKRSMADLRAIGTAIEAYSLDHNHYPAGADINTLIVFLDPYFIRVTPTRDGWSHPWVVDVSAIDYTIGSEGKDGAGGLAPCASAPLCTELADAIIFTKGHFAQLPDGPQR